jgi:hypothetical protein
MDRTHDIQEQDAAWLKEHVAFEEQPENVIEVPSVVRTWDPAIQRYREALDEEAAEMRESRTAFQPVCKAARMAEEDRDYQPVLEMGLS